MNSREANPDREVFPIPPADAFLSPKIEPENLDLENRKLSALVRILSAHPLVGAYMKMKISDAQFSSKLQDAVAQSRMQATMFARLDAGNARADIEVEKKAGSFVSFLDDRWVRAVGEAQLETLFRRKHAELSLLREVPVSAMSAERHGAALRAVQLLAASKTMVKHAKSHGDDDFESLRAVEFARFLEILGCTREHLPAVLKFIRAEALIKGEPVPVSKSLRKAVEVPERASSSVIRSTFRRIVAALPFFRDSAK